jgi:hypothetical protein
MAHALKAVNEHPWGFAVNAMCSAYGRHTVRQPHICHLPGLVLNCILRRGQGGGQPSVVAVGLAREPGIRDHKVWYWEGRLLYFGEVPATLGARGSAPIHTLQSDSSVEYRV